MLANIEDCQEKEKEVFVVSVVLLVEVLADLQQENHYRAGSRCGGLTRYPFRKSSLASSRPERSTGVGDGAGAPSAGASSRANIRQAR